MKLLQVFVFFCGIIKVHRGFSFAVETSIDNLDSALVNSEEFLALVSSLLQFECDNSTIHHFLLLRLMKAELRKKVLEEILEPQ
jgi:hypothetical protein